MNGYTLAAIPPTLLLIAKPDLWAWALAVAALVALAALSAAAGHFRGQRDEARAELEHRADLTDELASAVAMAESLADELSHADTTIRNLAAQVVGSKGTRLRVVPPISEDDYWVRLMKATEER